MQNISHFAQNLTSLGMVYVKIIIRRCDQGNIW